jgi:hypothetical protein
VDECALEKALLTRQGREAFRVFASHKKPLLANLGEGRCGSTRPRFDQRPTIEKM